MNDGSVVATIDLVAEDFDSRAGDVDEIEVLASHRYEVPIDEVDVAIADAEMAGRHPQNQIATGPPDLSDETVVEADLGSEAQWIARLAEGRPQMGE